MSHAENEGSGQPQEGGPSYPSKIKKKTSGGLMMGGKWGFVILQITCPLPND